MNIQVVYDVQTNVINVNSCHKADAIERSCINNVKDVSHFVMGFYPYNVYVFNGSL